jgi:hypothetical protein
VWITSSPSPSNTSSTDSKQNMFYPHTPGDASVLKLKVFYSFWIKSFKARPRLCSKSCTCIIIRKITPNKIFMGSQNHFVRYLTLLLLLFWLKRTMVNLLNSIILRKISLKEKNLPYAFVLIIWYHKDAEFTCAREKITALC